jgi:hypothetical protein
VQHVQTETEGFSFQQSFRERFMRAVSKAAPYAAGVLGFAIAMIASPDERRSHEGALFFVALVLICTLGYTLWTAWSNLYLEGPRLGLRDILRTAGKSLLTGLLAAGGHQVFAWALKS